MLIVWRRSGQNLLIGDNIEIEVLEARTNRVKLGIVAPDAVPIVRGEARITRDENLAAALSADREMIETLLRVVPRKLSRLQTSKARPSNP